jgi:hypothetical protein
MCRAGTELVGWTGYEVETCNDLSQNVCPAKTKIRAHRRATNVRPSLAQVKDIFGYFSPIENSLNMTV